VKQALSGGSLVVFGDGQQTRDFVYVDDVVDALVSAATATSVDRGIINVGSGQEVSIHQVVEKVARATRQRVTPPLHNSTESGGVSRLVADIELARQLLGFRPKVDLDQGLRLLLERDPRFHR
jgi:UDP-glucose 4-epimerase